MTATWRVLPLAAHDAATSMAIDEAIGEAVAAGDVPPTIRFYRWSPSAVSIGYFQSLAAEVDRDACRADGIDVVRRRTGGGAVYHDYDGEITYSVIAPVDLYSEDVETSFETICGAVVEALDRLGIAAAFAPINDVVVDGEKISGSAQTRRDGVLLQHGTVLHDVHPERMFTYLRPDVESISDKHVQSVRKRVTSITDRIGETPLDRTHEALRAAFAADRDTIPGELTPTERERADDLADRRYRDDEWTAQR